MAMKGPLPLPPPLPPPPPPPPPRPPPEESPANRHHTLRTTPPATGDTMLTALWATTTPTLRHTPQDINRPTLRCMPRGLAPPTPPPMAPPTPHVLLGTAPRRTTATWDSSNTPAPPTRGVATHQRRLSLESAMERSEVTENIPSKCPTFVKCQQNINDRPSDFC